MNFHKHIQMDFVENLLGGGGGGGNFKAQAADLINPTSMGQVNSAYQQAQGGLTQQQAFLNALRGQNGIQNQSDVFGQQQALANQLQGVANGTGPNPALQQLQNTTGQNVANQAALMAGQRGSGANAGLLARQAAMQGANTQQQAVGQGAALAAQQQLSGLGMLQGQQGMMGNLAGQQVGQQGGALQGLNQAGQSEQQQLLNALGQYNNQNVNMQSNMNSSNAGVQSGVAQGQQGLLGGTLGGLGAGLMMLHDGGAVKNYADGGTVDGPQSYAGKFLKGWMSQPSAGNDLASMGNVSNANPGAGQLNKGMDSFGKGLGSAIGSFINNQGGPDLTTAQPNSVNHGLMEAKGGSINAKSGVKVPGKASVKGDSLKNDTVPAMLSPGEVVIPRHVMQSDDPIGNSAKFVQAVMNKKGGKK